MSASPLAMWITAAALLATSCAGGTEPGRQSARDLERREIIVVDDDANIPQPCRPGSIARLLWKLFDGVNSSDLSVIDEVVGPPSKFKWYSISEGNPQRDGRQFTAYNAGDMQAYLEARITQDERLALLALQVKYEPARQIANLQMAVSRTANDLKELGFANSIAHGKGVVECKTGRIILMSIGLEDTDPPSVTEAINKLCEADSVSGERETVACTA